MWQVGGDAPNSCQQVGTTVVCPVVDGCTTCPGSHPFIVGHYLNYVHEGLGSSYDASYPVVCDTLENAASAPYGLSCNPGGQLESTWDSGAEFSCVKTVVNAWYLDTTANYFTANGGKSLVFFLLILRDEPVSSGYEVLIFIS